MQLHKLPSKHETNQNKVNFSGRRMIFLEWVNKVRLMHLAVVYLCIFSDLPATYLLLLYNATRSGHGE